jgi:hypothetical protein
MDSRVMILCDHRASGITADLNDSYFVGIEPRPNGGALVQWTDLPEQAMVFADAAAAAEFCRDSPLEMFVFSFVPMAGPYRPVPASPPGPVESEADFLERLNRIATGADPRPVKAEACPHQEPVSLADEFRKMGLT